MNVSGLGELSWKMDVFGILGEFRSEFRSASAPLGGGAKVSSPERVSLAN
jgi:hypothetical protein